MATVEELTAQLAVKDAEIERQKGIAQNLGGKVTDFEKRFSGIDPEKAKADAAALAQLQQDAAKGDPAKVKELVEAAKDEVRRTLAKDIKDRDDKLSAITGQLKEKTVVDGVFGKAVSKLYDKAHDDFKDYVRRYCDVNDRNEVIIKNEKGEVRYSPKNAAVPMSVDELIGELSETRDHWFANPTPQGGKQSGQKYTNGTAPVTLESLKTMSAEDRNKAIFSLKPEEREALLAKSLGA